MNDEEIYDPMTGMKLWPIEDSKQPQQEPVTYTGNGTAGREADVRPTAFFFQMPPQRKPLTKEQIRAIAYGDMGTDANEFRDFVLPLARAIEAAHGIKE